MVESCGYGMVDRPLGSGGLQRTVSCEAGFFFTNRETHFFFFFEMSMTFAVLLTT